MATATLLTSQRTVEEVVAGILSLSPTNAVSSVHWGGPENLPDAFLCRLCPQVSSHCDALALTCVARDLAIRCFHPKNPMKHTDSLAQKNPSVR